VTFSRSTLLLLLVAVSLMAQGTANTIAQWNGTTFISSFGVPDTATYGQLINIPAGPGTLESFAFEIGNCSAAVSFRGSVYAWNGTMATGPSLYQSGVMTVPAGSTYTLVTFDTGGLRLDAGTYVLFASTSQDQAGDVACRWGSLPSDSAYPGGHFVFLNNGTNTGAWTTTAWSSIFQDLAFRSTFTPDPGVAPIPDTLWLVLAGLIGIWSLSRFRRWSRPPTAS
jgi:hypothetical protein